MRLRSALELQPLFSPYQMAPLGEVSPPSSENTAYSSDSDSDQSTDQSTVSFASSASTEVYLCSQEETQVKTLNALPCHSHQ